MKHRKWIIKKLFCFTSISFKEKYGESTTSNLMLKKFMSSSLLSVFKTCLKSKGLKTFFWELADFSSRRSARQYLGFIYRK